MRRLPYYFAVTALSLLLSSVTLKAAATTMRALSLSALVERADVIAVAQAGASASHFNDTGKVIVTDVELALLKQLKGKAQSTVHVRHLGGSVGRLGLRVPGEARFAEGERYLVFLETTSDPNLLRPIGMSQGVLPIAGVDEGAVVQPNPEHVRLLRQEHTGALAEGGAALEQELPLSSMLERISALLKR